MPSSTARTSLLAALAIVFVGLAACAPAIPIGELAPSAGRATNEGRAADLQVLDEWEERLQALRAQPASDTLPPRASSDDRKRAMAMASAWLAFARDEYVRAPSSPVVDEAFAQARRIIVDGEEGRPLLAQPTPLVLGTTRVRGDLWTRLERLRAYTDAEPALLGEASVLLVRAGRVSIPGDTTVCDPAPFLARAEDVLGELVAQLEPRERVLVLAGTPAVTRPRLAMAAPPVPVIVRSVHFALDRDSLGPAGRQVLDLLVGSLRGREGVVVELQGFADPRGSADYNLELSRRRALAVQQYIESRTTAIARFDLKPVGRARQTAGSDRVQLARDRRVDLRVILRDGSEALRTDELEGDLQLESARRAGSRTAGADGG